MKKLFLILLVLFDMIVANGQTSNYFPFQDSTYYRVDNVLHNSFQYPFFVKSYFHYSIMGDTLINSIVYKKVYKSYMFVHVYYWTLPTDPPQSQPPIYAGSLRDDSVGNKIMFVFPGKDTDSLLFDYNLSVGDTLRGHLSTAPAANNNTIVQSIDSVLINGQYRRRWNFGQCNYNDQYFIEGIGASTGLIEPFCVYSSLLADNYLVCVMDNENTLFTSDYISDFGCTLIFVGNYEIKPSERIVFYPNPFKTQMTLNSDIYFNDASLLIFNAVGQKVRQIDFINGHTITINRDALSNGLYFLLIIQNNKVILTGKTVIADK